MDKKYSFIRACALTLMVIAALTVNAKSWRINNNEALKPNFTSINAAMSSDEVLAGDTLYLDPGCTLSDAQTVSKAVTVVGPGYFLENLPYNEATFSGSLSLSAAGCKIEGCTISGRITINSQDVTIERCSTGLIDMNNQQNAVIRSCYVYYVGPSGESGSVISGGNNSIIENCVIRLYRYGGMLIYRTVSGLNNCILRNNYIERLYASPYGSDRSSYGPISVVQNLTNCEITNNIILNKTTGYSRYAYSSLTDCTVYHNLLSSPADELYPYNKFDQDYSSIFAGGTNDLEFMLKADSPAIGYATDGGDCGPYGSGYTYVASGLPFGRPYYTTMNIVLPDTDGKLKVTLNTKIQDE